MEDLHILCTHCIINGISYIVRKIEDKTVTYERCVCDNELFQKTLNEIDAVFSINYCYKQKSERKVLYINSNMNPSIIDYIFKNSHTNNLLLDNNTKE